MGKNARSSIGPSGTFHLVWSYTEGTPVFSYNSLRRTNRMFVAMGDRSHQQVKK